MAVHWHWPSSSMAVHWYWPSSACCHSYRCCLCWWCGHQQQVSWVSNTSGVRTLEETNLRTYSFCKTAFSELRHISTIRQYLSVEATKTLVVFTCTLSVWLFQLFLCRPPTVLDLYKLQRVQNCAARLVIRASSSVHVTPILKQLHWLSVKTRISYKTAHLCFNTINYSTPAYLFDLLHLYSPSRSLRFSADTRFLKLTLYKCKTKGDRAFSHFAMCLKLIATSHQKCCNYLHFQVRSQNPSLKPSRIWLAKSCLVCVCVCARARACVCVCVAFQSYQLCILDFCAYIPTHSPVSCFAKSLEPFKNWRCRIDRYHYQTGYLWSNGSVNPALELTNQGGGGYTLHVKGGGGYT